MQYQTNTHRSKDDSILSRPRQSRGLPNSFSFNLGRRTTSNEQPAKPSREAAHTKSVKSIVAWLEASPNCLQKDISAANVGLSFSQSTTKDVNETRPPAEVAVRSKTPAASNDVGERMSNGTSSSTQPNTLNSGGLQKHAGVGAEGKDPTMKTYDHHLLETDNVVETWDSGPFVRDMQDVRSF